MEITISYYYVTWSVGVFLEGENGETWKGTLSMTFHFYLGGDYYRVYFDLYL